jgi:hypothetical protein
MAEGAPLRTISVGIREVLGAALPGEPARGDVRALLLGTRIDTRNLRDFAEPETLNLSGVGAAFVFR